MVTCVALIRGINVGGKSILPMKSLAEILAAMGFEKVKTYIQSGNAVFQCDKKHGSIIAREISLKILERHGFKPEILLLEIKKLQDAIDNNPFETVNGRAVHFFFLNSQPSHPDLELLLSVKSKSEEFKLHNDIFYLYAPDGIGRSKLVAKIEQVLGVSATARNWNTVNKLMTMAKQG